MGVQVDLATHKRDSEGNLIPLSVNKRQFISFSYGGENIEDFDLLVVFSNDRLDKSIYSSFNDITSKNDVIDGQLFWASVFDAGRLSFTLATDGMTSENYERFKNWFIPGQARELILTEFPNRVIFARVAAAPQISLLPFENKKKAVIAGQEKEISTSLYKGDITLEFVMDDPYWEAKTNLIDDSAENYIYSDEEIKIIYEDKIPSLKMFPTDDNYYILGNDKIIHNGAVTNDIFTISETSNVLLYNCGVAAAKPITSFTFTPSFDENDYISSPGNSYAGTEYSYLQVGNSTLEFTTPSLLTSYNHAISIIKNIYDGYSILDLRQQLRDELHNYYTRAWAIAIIDGLKETRGEDDSYTYVDASGAILNAEEFQLTFTTMMKEFIDGSDIECTIDSKIGQVKIATFCKVNSGKLDSVAAAEAIEPIYIEENAGDMIKSKYLKLEDRTTFNPETGYITKDDCVEISSNCSLTDLKISFKYTYL